MIIEPGVATKVPSACCVPVDDDVAPDLEEIGHRARVEDRDALLVAALDVPEREAEAAGVRIAGRRPTTRPAS